MKWIPGKQYKMKDASKCDSMTVTDTGEVVVWLRLYGLTWEVRWYDQNGELLHTLPPPPNCEGLHIIAHHVLAVPRKQKVAFSCPFCQCIWLGSQGAKEWSVAWRATGEEGSEERKSQPMPKTMCQGKPGQIIAHYKKSVSVFDITQIPFRVVVPKMTLGIEAEYLCYCELPGVGDALAVTDPYHACKLCMFSLDSGAILWSIGGKDKKGHRVKVAGAQWFPMGVCSDNRGRLYVVNWKEGNGPILVLLAASGSVLQVIQGKGHWEERMLRKYWVADPGVTVYKPDIKYKDDEPKKGVESGTVLQEIKDQSLEYNMKLCWEEHNKSIIVGNGGDEDKISYFQIAF